MNSIFMFILLLIITTPISESTPHGALFKIVTHESKDDEDNNYNTTDRFFRNRQLQVREKRRILPQLVPQTFLKLFNGFRSNEGASNMIKIRWDDSIAENSRLWSLKCDYRHPNYAGRFLGKIFHWSSGKHVYYDYVEALQNWYDQRNDYSYDFGNCSNTCDSYETMVKWDFIQMGCSSVFCPKLLYQDYYYDDAAILSCEFYSAIKDNSSILYNKGPACSECPESHPNCEDNLCTGPDSSYPPWDPSELPPHALPDTTTTTKKTTTTFKTTTGTTEEVPAISFSQALSYGTCALSFSLLIHILIKGYF